MSGAIRVFVNASPVEVPAGADVREAIRAHDPELERRAAAGAALVTDARGIEVPLGAPLEAGSILRVVLRARRGEPDTDADA